MKNLNYKTARVMSFFKRSFLLCMFACFTHVQAQNDNDIFLEVGETHVFDQTGNLQFDGTISGEGKVVQEGNGTTSLTKANSYTGGTELRRGGILMKNAASVGTMTTDNGLAGHVLYSTTGSDNVRTFEVDAAVNQITNHFHIAGGNDNIFRMNGDLTISGIENYSTQQNLGGAFYVGTGSSLVINANGDLALSGNSYNAGNGSIANDIYLMTGSILNVNVADGTGMFIGSGIRGEGELIEEQGTIVLNGSGPDDNDGFLQLAANSFVANADIQSGRLRLADNRFLSNSEAFTLAAGASFEGEGYLYADDDSLIRGIVSPDAAKFTSGTDMVGAAEKIGVLQIQGGSTHFNGFTFQYDAVAANGTNKNSGQTPNDLIQLASQPAYIHSGTVNFRTGSEGLRSGNYLVIHSIASRFKDGGGTDLDNTSLNTVLSGQMNGVAFDDIGPRILSTNFYFDKQDDSGTHGDNSQIWLEAESNTLQVAWQGEADNKWMMSNNWKSTQVNDLGGSEIRDNKFYSGDYVIFNSSADHDVELDEIAIVSGMDVDTDQTITITGTGGIHAIQTNSGGNNYIEGIYAKADDSADPLQQEFNTTGKLVKTGTGALVFATTGNNYFENGIELEEGTLRLLTNLASSEVSLGNATLETAANTKIHSLLSDKGSINPEGTLTILEDMEINGTTIHFNGTNGISNKIQVDGSVAFGTDKNNIDLHFTASGEYILISSSNGFAGFDPENFTFTQNGAELPDNLQVNVKLEENNLILSVTNTSNIENTAISHAGVSVYPNPTSGGEPIRIETWLPDEQLEKARLDIINSYGVRIHEQEVGGKHTEVIMPETPGIYMIRVHSGNFTQTVKVIVK